MTLAAALGGLQANLYGVRCTVCELLNVLVGEDRSALVGALEDRSLSGSVIESALRSEGLRVGVGAANRHRRGECWGAGV